MPLTRAEFEAELIQFAGPKLTMVGMDGTTIDGTNASLNSALREALAALGIESAGLTVIDADFATLSRADMPKLLALAAQRLFRLSLFRWNRGRVSEDRSSQDWQQSYDSIRAALDYWTDVVDGYGLGTPSISLGVLSLGILEPADDGAEF